MVKEAEDLSPKILPGISEIVKSDSPTYINNYMTF